MRIEIKTSSYNKQRCGRPYIARIDFDADPKGVPVWGDWIGHAGEEGILSVHAEPGSLIMQGQWDNRSPRNSEPLYAMVEQDGTLTWYTTKAAAWEAHRAANAANSGEVSA